MSGDGSILVFDTFLKDRSEVCHLVDGRNGQVIRSLPRIGSQTQPTLSRDGRLLLVLKYTGPTQPFVDLIETATGNSLAQVPVSQGISFPSRALVPDGSGFIVVGADRRVVRYDIIPETGTPNTIPASPDPTRLTFKERHKVQLEFLPVGMKFDPSGQLFVARSFEKSVTVVDVQTGSVRPLPERGILSLPSVLPLTDGRVGVWCLGEKEIVITDKTGKPADTIPLPEFPPTKFQPIIATIVISPDERFVAVGEQSRFAPEPNMGKGVHTPAPLRVLDRKTGKNVLERDWYTGAIFFNADASRMLVVDAYFHGRWYKLPSGELEKEWKFGDQTSGAPELYQLLASRDGRVLLCSNRLDNRFTHFTLDGETGKKSVGFWRDRDWRIGGLSADGKLALLWEPGTNLRGGELYVFELGKGTEVARLKIPASVEFDSVAFAPDGRTAIVTNRFKSTPTIIYELTDTGTAVAPKPKDPPLPNPGKVFELKQKWSKDVEVQLDTANPYIDRDGQVIALVNRGTNWGTAAVNAKTGATIRDLTNMKGEFYRLIPLEKGKFAFQTRNGKNILVWDPMNKKETRFTFPQPVGGTRGPPTLNVSPNGRYMAVGHYRPDPRPNEPYPESRFQVTDTNTNKVVVAFDWPPGTTLFTPDSSRILVVDATDRFRWFKLPSGKPDGQWKFDRKATQFNAQVLSMSADGGVILHYGQPPDKERTHHLLDGKTGAVLYSFPAKRYLSYQGYVSDDGRFVVLIRTDGFGIGHTVEVLDIRGSLLARVRIPQGQEGTMVTVSWKARTVVMYDRGTKKLTTYDLPDNATLEGLRPK